MSGSNQLPAISLDELERLIRLLGMLGSDFDAEVLAAARHAVRWVAEKHTDWRTLLTPPEEPGVVSVSVAVQEDEFLAREEHAYQRGYRAGMANGIKAAAAQVKAQAQAATGPAGSGSMASQGPSQWSSGRVWAANAPGSGLGGPGTGPGFGTAASAQGPVAPPGGPPGAPSGALWAPGTWQRVCQDLLDQHAAVPGVLRSREEIFVADILRRGFASLTPAQEHWLRDIAGRNHMTW